MHVITLQGAVDDCHAHLGTDLLNSLAHPEPDLAMEHLEPILGAQTR